MMSTRRREGSGSSGHMWKGEEGSAKCGRPQEELEATNIILSLNGVGLNSGI